MSFAGRRGGAGVLTKAPTLHFAAGVAESGLSASRLRNLFMPDFYDTRSFDPCRAEGLRRLAVFLPAAGWSYANGRNTDSGPDDRRHVSTLSPYIRHRLITEREVLDAVLQGHSLTTAEKFIQEVYWRTYFKGHLETRPQIWRRYREALDQQFATIADGGGLARAYSAAIAGHTGIECFDAWVDELRETGYLHNHTRMWLASIWIFTLKLPWELGADFTYRHFIDGDPASNTLSWRWVAGLHTKGKTYLARAANIAEFTCGRFDPKGLASTAPPLEEPPIGPAILLVTEDDLHPESLDLSDADIRAVIGPHPGDHRSLLASAERVVRFSQEALVDGLRRAADHFGVAAGTDAHFSPASLAKLARSHCVSRIVTAYAPVGPMGDRFAALTSVLAHEGIELVQIQRPEDAAAWPYATKGFFGLKDRIPHLIRTLGIGEAGFK